jgi:mono/diheme cytochrome c family protein
MSFLKYIAPVALMAIAACQFLPWGRVPALQTADGSAIHSSKLDNPAVEAILNRSCVECHSSKASLPWYGHVAPVSWLVASHVNRGIGKWDLAVWDTRRPQHGEMEDICDAVTDGSMPLRSYTWVHPRARLTQRDRETLCNWADASSANAPSTR